MPRLSRLMVRMSLLYFTLGSTLGALILIQKASNLLPWAWIGLPTHIEWMLAGWMTQFALGIAFWILPRLSGPAPRGRKIWTQWTFILLNAGIWLVCFSSLTAQPHFMMLARLLEVAALITFGIGNWPRIRALSALREKSRPF